MISKVRRRSPPGLGLRPGRTPCHQRHQSVQPASQDLATALVRLCASLPRRHRAPRPSACAFSPPIRADGATACGGQALAKNRVTPGKATTPPGAVPPAMGTAIHGAVVDLDDISVLHGQAQMPCIAFDPGRTQHGEDVGIEVVPRESPRVDEPPEALKPQRDILRAEGRPGRPDQRPDDDLRGAIGPAQPDVPQRGIV